MDNQNEAILRQMEGTRASLTEKLEALENQIAGKVQAGANVVDRTTEAANQIVDTVKATVHEVKESVDRSMESVTSAFDLRKQTDKHPWVVVGLATAAGCVLGNIMGRRDVQTVGTQESVPTFKPVASRPKHTKVPEGGNGHGTKKASGHSDFWEQDWVRDQLTRLKGLALGTLLSVVRDMAKQSITGPLGERVAEEIENFTTRVGAEPIRGQVLSFEESSGNEGTSAQQRSTTDVAPSEASAGPVNRLVSGGGSGLGLR